MEHVRQRAPVQHVCVNAAKLVAVARDPEFRRVVTNCGIISADGQSVVWAARLLGQRLPARVAGIDLMEVLLNDAAQAGHRVFFLGATDQVLDMAIARVCQRHPNLRVAGRHHGYSPPAQDAEIAAMIRESDADILFVALPSPRKEKWLAEYQAVAGVPFAMGVGGSLDVVAGLVRRAPRWAQRAGLEWFFRMLQEPRRLTGRYARTNGAFAWMVFQEMKVRRGWRRP
jgi:N-acetylglucosaminyldiphosphoundecaprenol N-acetyl-beta-D-mannosaminyltransferase